MTIKGRLNLWKRDMLKGFFFSEENSLILKIKVISIGIAIVIGLILQKFVINVIGDEIP